MIKKLFLKLQHSTHIYLLLLLLFVLFLTYWDLIKNFNTLSFGNDLSMNWAYFDFIQKSVHKFHQYPLWLPNLFSGFPLDSSNLAGLFYPPHLLMVFLPLKAGINFLTIAHIYLIGVASYVLALNLLKVKPWAAFIAALSIMISPKLMNHNYLGHINLIESIPWMILAIFFFCKSIETKKIFFAICSGFFLALVITVFSIFYIYSLIALGFYALVNFFWKLSLPSLKQRLLEFRFIATALLSSLLFGAVFLLPLLKFSSVSLRTRLTFWEGAFPALFLDNFNQLFFFLPHRFHNSETLIYVGIATLLLAFLGLREFRSKKVVFFFFLAIFTVTVALGANTLFYKIYYRLLPFFHFMRAPLRIWILFILSSGFLSAIGMNYLLTKFPRKEFLLILLTVGSIFTTLQIYNKDYFVLVNYDKSSEKITQLLSDKDARIYCLTNCLVTPDGIVKGRQFSSGGEVVLLNDYYDFMKVAGGYNFSGYSLSVPPYQVFDTKGIYFEKQSPDPQLLALTNTKYLISPYPLSNEKYRLIGNQDNYYIYENLAYLAKAFSVTSATPFKDFNSLRNIDFTKDVVIKNLPQPATNVGQFAKQEVTYYSPNQVVVKTKTDSESYLVLTDTFFPGWKAKVDGQETTIFEANGSFRAVKISQGEHEVEFTYFPESLKLGLAISILSLGSFVFLLLSRKRFKVINQKF